MIVVVSSVQNKTLVKKCWILLYSEYCSADEQTIQGAILEITFLSMIPSNKVLISKFN